MPKQSKIRQKSVKLYRGCNDFVHIELITAYFALSLKRTAT